MAFSPYPSKRAGSGIDFAKGYAMKHMRLTVGE
jgi:hypothetical protein